MRPFRVSFLVVYIAVASFFLYTPAIAQELPIIDLRLPITLYTGEARFTRLAERFNDLSDELRLGVVLINANQTDDLLAALASGRVDLMDLNFFYYDVVNQGYAVNLDPWIQRSPELRPWQPYLDAVRDEWGQFVIPLSRVPILLFAWPDHFSAAGLPLPSEGWTWDDFIDASIALVDPRQERYGFVGAHTSTWQLPFLQTGQTLHTAHIADMRFGLQLIHGLIHVHRSHLPLKMGNALWTHTDFLARRASMATFSPLMLQLAGAQVRDLVVLPLPTLDAAVAPSSVGSLQMFIGIASTSPHVAEAWSVLEWLTSAAGAEAILRSAGVLPLFAHPQTHRLAEQLYGDTASEMFREPFLVVQDFRDFRRPGAADFYVTVTNTADAYLTGRLSLDAALEAIEGARLTFSSLQ